MNATLLVFGLFLAIYLPEVSAGANKSHNALFGSRKSGDELLFMDHPNMQSSMLRKVTYDVAYPSKYDTRGTITYIEVLDQFTDGNGGTAAIQNGGVGSDHVRIHLKSKRSYGLNFIVRIYGFKIYMG